MMFKVIGFLSIATAILFFKRESDFNKETVKGKCVVITGASTGIGEQLAYQYAELGANVFITARRADVLKKIVQRCMSINPDGNFGYFAADMAKYKAESKPLIEKAVHYLGAIDSLIVNHVYYGHFTPWHGTQQELDMFDRMDDINFRSYVHIISHALPHLKSSPNGRLGIISSISGKIPSPLLTAYCGNKFALDGFFSSLREELAQANKNVTITISPIGVIDTENSNRVRELLTARVEAPGSIVSVAKEIKATADEAAEKIIEATETGKSELYHPYWFSNSVITYPSSWIAITRHLWAKLVEKVVFSSSFYEHWEPV